MRGGIARTVVAGAAVGLAVTGLAGCRTSPTVAAYVGDEQVSVAELETAVDQRLADPALAAAAEPRRADYTRQVLSTLVDSAVHTEAAQRYGVTVDDGEVRRRIDQLLTGRNADEEYAQLAQRGIGRADVVEVVRQQLVRQKIAAEEGLAEGLEEPALRARYEEQRESFRQVQLGFITVPDQPTADGVLAELTANPASYPALAARHPGESTLPAVEARSRDALPAALADRIVATAPGTGFTVPLPQAGGIVVVFVAGVVEPPFEEVRPQLEQAAAAEIEGPATEAVQKVRDQLQIDVNPRFGVLGDEGIVPADGGVVDILESGAGGGTGPRAD